MMKDDDKLTRRLVPLITSYIFQSHIMRATDSNT